MNKRAFKVPEDGLPGDEARLFILYFNLAIAFIQFELDASREKAISLLQKDKRSAAVEKLNNRAIAMSAAIQASYEDD